MGWFSSNKTSKPGSFGVAKAAKTGKGKKSGKKAPGKSSSSGDGWFSTVEAFDHFHEYCYGKNDE
jgi:hypothetical protein